MNRPDESLCMAITKRGQACQAFRIIISEERQRPGLARDLQELPGIFQWALEGLRRLQQRGQFTSSVCPEESQTMPPADETAA